MEFLFCFDTGDLVVPPFLFHYSFKRGVQKKDRLNWVESISKTHTLTFKNGASGQISSKLKPYFSWLWKYQPTFNPNERCKITKKDGEVNPKNYELICETTSGSENEHKWTKDVPSSQVVKPTIDLKKQADQLIK
ncbi:hypothetical protein WEN_02950 [Mycoplasma wenyonii str. Massachusetts]|uniref:Uncharacterized protein n=1 Tax=Mycoplasma wenyonii (strain Massachusetts) TaxID=1197325 RepID=I6Z6Y5_MYCWM|nr:hypothetical protein [Mycoplasma wenyonii]AFN65373.1 hypothetical protein WEN_02950 [Mycoplasma wenyonii str. Massachusetts]